MGPSPAIPFSREPKARREALAKQLPLQEGRKVAFHPPAGKTADGSIVDTDENTWILAVITKCINQDKNRWAHFCPAHTETYSASDMKCKTLNRRKTGRLDSTSSFY